MTALVDFDVMVYYTGFACKGDYIQCIELLEGLLGSIYNATGATDSHLVLSGKGNFRLSVSDTYKSSRKDKPKPRYYKALRDYGIEWLGASVADGMEADDYLGILQDKEGKDTIICSNDKDMLCVPGLHYRISRPWSNNHIVLVSKEEAMYNFFRQVLMGDATDDVRGLRGIGEAKSKKLLQGLSVDEMKQVALNLYEEHYGEDGVKEFDKTARLIWIKQDFNKEYYDYL